MKKCGFFGGTFDPIHLGHLNLARSILQKKQLDHILFSPANFSPEKERERPQASNQERREMVELAIEEDASFSLVDLELERNGPSYTVDTIRHLIEEYPDMQFYLILGEDLLSGLSNWKEIDTLLELAPPLVGTRPHAVIPQLSPRISAAVSKGKVLISPMEISSTEVRENLAQKKNCEHLIPPKVLDYIKVHRLY